MKSAEVIIRNPHGLHARPGARFVKAANRFRSRVEIRDVTTGKAPVNAKSAGSIYGGGFMHGHTVELIANGEDEAEAIDALRAAIEDGLGEEIDSEREAAPAPPMRPVHAKSEPTAPSASSAEPAAPGRLRGVPAAPGIAVARPWIYRPPRRSAAGEPIGPEAIAPAAEEAARQLEALAERVGRLGRGEDADIFSAQAVLATDPELLDRAVARATAGDEATAAVTAAAEESAATVAALEDELLAARAADIRDVGARIVRILRNESLDLPETPSIAVADDLPPSVTAEIPLGLLQGIALESGSPTAHAAILARGLGIPAVVGVKGLLAVAERASEIGIDGETGAVLADPSDEERAALAARAAALRAAHERAADLRTRPAATSDGHRVKLLANIGGPGDVAAALEAGAEGVGLFRTEFLFMRRATAPTEHEQAVAYRRVLEGFGPERPVVVRLADIGGDKGIPYLQLPAEANPFLGVRAIRLAYADRPLLRTQLKAILRAGAAARAAPHVMAPMVATSGDLDLYDELCDEAARELRDEGLTLAETIVKGIMVEIPAAAVMAVEFARRVDFFSIGTNDLTQYALAADRGNAGLTPLHDALNPAVLRLIRMTVDGAHAAGIPVAVCGELAGDPAGAIVLAGLGVDELSADARSLDGVRVALGSRSIGDLRDLGARCLDLPDAASVRAAARELLADLSAV